MRLDWLLFSKSFTTSWKRLALIAGAVSIGVLILLAFTASFNSLTAMTGSLKQAGWVSALLKKRGHHQSCRN